MNDIQKKEKNDFMVTDFEHTQRMCQMLMQTAHYKKMGEEGVFAILEKAKSVGVNPLDALNGGMYFVKGKVEMSAAMMNQLIRAKKHSITKDKRSDETICILHGKRADNGDTWTESFSIDDAKQARIYGDTWAKYPKDMLFARALSRLARQLFPDVIKGCYVEGEIKALDDADYEEEADYEVVDTEFKQPQKEETRSLSHEEEEYLNEMIGDDAAYRECVMKFLFNQFKITELSMMPRDIFDKVLPVAERKYQDRKRLAFGQVSGEEAQLAYGG